LSILLFFILKRRFPADVYHSTVECLGLGGRLVLCA